MNSFILIHLSSILLVNHFVLAADSSSKDAIDLTDLELEKAITHALSSKTSDRAAYFLQRPEATHDELTASQNSKMRTHVERSNRIHEFGKQFFNDEIEGWTVERVPIEKADIKDVICSGDRFCTGVLSDGEMIHASHCVRTDGYYCHVTRTNRRTGQTTQWELGPAKVYFDMLKAGYESRSAK